MVGSREMKFQSRRMEKFRLIWTETCSRKNKNANPPLDAAENAFSKDLFVGHLEYCWVSQETWKCLDK